MLNRDQEKLLNEQPYRRLVESIEDFAIFLLDNDGYIRSWNRGAEHMKGYAPEEILGRHFSVFYTQDAVSANCPQRGLDCAAKTGRYEEDAWRVRKDGTKFLANVVIKPMIDQAGQLDGYTKIIKDITELVLHEERFRRVVESAPNAMILTNTQGRIEMVNTQTERLFGYCREELLGQPIEILVPERFRTAHPHKREHFFHDPQSRPMGAGRDLYGRRKDGREFPVEVGLNPIETSGEVMVLSSVVDISERKRQEERFRQVVESAPNAMVLVNTKGRIELVNTQTERVFGYQREELLGQPIEILVPERFRIEHPIKRGDYFQTPASRPMGAGRDLHGKRKDGTEFPVEIGLNPIESDDGIMVLSSIVDISDRKNKESRIQAALKEKELLLGEIHHRVKNNLQVIDSILNLQVGGISDPVVQSMLHDCQNRVRSMALIHQSLYQSKDFGRVNFGEFLEMLAPTLSNSYRANCQDIRLNVDVQSVFLPINAAVPCALIVNELMTNAMKHAFPSNTGGKISVLMSSKQKNIAVLVVEDDGVGFATDIDFENTETLGLSLVSMLSHQLLGSLTINRRNPTRFTIEFPITEE